MKWGVLFSPDNKAHVHLVPVDPHGFPAGGHVLTPLCQCIPTLEPREDGSTVVMHQDRGDQ